jgi:hypothetical protein
VKAACTILISSAGRRVELILCFRDGAARLGLDLRVIAVDLDPAMSAACQVADLAVRVPRCDRTKFIDELLRVCLRHKVDLGVPTIDPELEPLSAQAAHFGEIGVALAVAAPEVVRLARDQLRTAHFLVSRGVPTPRSGRLDEVTADPGAWLWPLMIKPRSGEQLGRHSHPVLTGPARLEPGSDHGRGGRPRRALLRVSFECSVNHGVETGGPRPNQLRASRGALLYSGSDAPVRACGGGPRWLSTLDQVALRRSHGERSG